MEEDSNQAYETLVKLHKKYFPEQETPSNFPETGINPLLEKIRSNTSAIYSKGREACEDKRTELQTTLDAMANYQESGRKIQHSLHLHLRMIEDIVQIGNALNPIRKISA